MAERGTCQDTERNQSTEAHSHPGDSRERDLSRHRKKPTDRGALTNWRRQTEGLVRTRKATDRPRRTHFLEAAEGGTCQDSKRNRSTEAHSQTGDGRGRNLLGLGKKPTDRGALTTWRQQMEGLVRTRKETDRPRRTHQLEAAERDLSGLGKKPTDQGALTFWRRQTEGHIRKRKETD